MQHIKDLLPTVEDIKARADEPVCVDCGEPLETEEDKRAGHHILV